MKKKPWPEIRKKMHEKFDLQIGKNGITQQIVTVAKQLLKQKKIIKVKFLKNIAETKEDAKKLAEELSEKTGAKIGKVMGKTAVLYKEE